MKVTVWETHWGPDFQTTWPRKSCLRIVPQREGSGLLWKQTEQGQILVLPLPSIMGMVAMTYTLSWCLSFLVSKMRIKKQYLCFGISVWITWTNISKTQQCLDTVTPIVITFILTMTAWLNLMLSLPDVKRGIKKIRSESVIQGLRKTACMTLSSQHRPCLGSLQIHVYLEDREA